ncbi:cupin-like domain-containing protein [Sphingomonas koreensis]|nr:cupin-like domain-containing protein [Sphingomonas koreensis]
MQPGTDATERLNMIVNDGVPVVLRGLVAEWPATRAASQSAAAFRDYCTTFAGTGEVEAFVGDPAIAGSYFYGDGVDGFNFERRRMSLHDAIDAVVRALDQPGSDTIYVGSVPVGEQLRGFVEANPLPLPGLAAAPRIWLGHMARIACHYDTLDNVACVVAGQRRFTLYPPEAIGDLYVGPIDKTMAGQPVSLAAAAPDPVRYPRFAAAAATAMHVELNAGDAVYIPKLWWHQVESTAPFNVLVNYWWDATASGPDAPYAALLLAMIAIAERPPRERLAWQAFFDHYVFRRAGHPLRHLPIDQHGALGPLRPSNYGRLRTLVMQMLRSR